MKPWQVLLVVAAALYLLAQVVTPAGLASFFHSVGEVVTWFRNVFAGEAT